MNANSPATSASAQIRFLLPRRDRLEGEPGAAPNLLRVWAKADASTQAEGDEAQLQRVFDILPRGLPVAALTRQFDLGDAQHLQWLRADPAHVRADMGAGRLLACGDLGLTTDEVDELLLPLKPLFGDAGSPISAGAPSRWYVSLPREAKLPVFAPPARALGDDIFPHLPEGDLGRRWRTLLSEAQIVLHNHPLNARRAVAGKLPVNSLWFWGGGVLPDHVRCVAQQLHSDDLLVAALARQAGANWSELPATLAVPSDVAMMVVDLRRVREMVRLDADWIAPALA